MQHSSLTRKPADYGRVGVLLGGDSAERAVSLNSGEAVYQGLLKAGVDAVKIDPKNGLYPQLVAEKIERVFIVLHGRGGEDGVVQGFLKVMDLPFTGSNVASAALAMDKLKSKQIWSQLEIPTADFQAIKRGDNFSQEKAVDVMQRLGNCLFVKPVKEGSSVGMSKVKSAKELVDAVALAHQFDSHALIERYIEGEEYTVSLINGRALPSISMRTPREFYDYKAKYESQTTEYFCPSGLSKKDEALLGDRALVAFEALGCSGWGRVDFIRDSISGEFLILEANTVPGMTETSLVPKAAKAVGINFESLLLQILDSSFLPSEAANV